MKKNILLRFIFVLKVISQTNKNISQSSYGFNVGDNVKHKVFGKGRIIEISGNGDLQKITIQFRAII